MINDPLLQINARAHAPSLIQPSLQGELLAHRHHFPVPLLLSIQHLLHCCRAAGAMRIEAQRRGDRVGRAQEQQREGSNHDSRAEHPAEGSVRGRHRRSTSTQLSIVRAASTTGAGVRPAASAP